MNWSDNELRIKTCQSSRQLWAGWPQNVVKVEGLIDERNTICGFTIIFSNIYDVQLQFVYSKTVHFHSCFQNNKT